MATIRIWTAHVDPQAEMDGHYVVEYDPTRPGVTPSGRPMLCHLVTTPDVEKATVYTPQEAFTVCNQSYGIRTDGKPNRPITAFHLEVG